MDRIQEDFDESSFSEFNAYQDDELENLNHRKKVKRMLEEKLERKRLKDEFKDEFDELSGDFDWDELDR